MAKDEIPELLGENGKFRYLFHNDLPRSVAKGNCGKEVTSFPTLAKAVGQRSHSEFAENKMGRPNLVRVARLYSIPMDSECWGEFCAGSLSHFITEFVALHPAVVPAAPSKQQAPVALAEDLHFIDADRKANDIAMLTVFAASNAPPAVAGSIHISFALNCPTMVDMSFRCGIKSGILKFDLGSGYTTHIRERRAFGEPAICDNARLTVHDNDTHCPSWRVESVDGQAIGNVADVPADFLLAHGLTPSMVVAATFRVFISELGVSFSLPDGEQEKGARAKLKQRLIQRKLIEDDDGSVDIAVARLRLVAKDAEGSA